MQKTDMSLASEFRVSPLWVLVTLPVLGLAFYALGEQLVDARELLPYALFALLMYGLAAGGWMLYRWHAEIGRWYAIVISGVAVFLGHFWLGIPGVLALVAVPPAVAVGVIGFAAALGIAVLETALLIVLRGFGALQVTAIGVPLITLWATFGALLAVHLPAREAAQWAWDYFQSARKLLEEARDRQGELAQALEDLARANQQLTRLNILAQGLRRAAEEARLAKEQFVANVSHELRTPLNMVIGFSEMILETPEAYGSSLPPALLADLAVIRRNAQHLAELIDDVLDLSQIEANQVALARESVPVNEIVEAAIEAVRPLFESKHLYLRSELPPNLPPIYGDRTRIREVMLNLLSNAGRFTERGGVCVKGWQDGEDLILSVADTGPGIAAEDMGRLFQPFQQLDGSIRRRYGGTGLGLSISKRFIELHGGKIWVESQKGVGTTFFVRLPIAPPQPAPAPVSRWLIPGWEYLQRTSEPAASRVPLRPRLVVLEEGNSLQRLLRRYLGDAEVVAVKEMSAALEALGASPSQALLINDTAVGEVLERLKSVSLPDGIPVLACSVPGTDESARALGIADYMVKPISRERLLGALDRLGLQQGTVLIVDDEPDALHLLQRMLHTSGQGYRVLKAHNGHEALRLLRHYRPDVILLDLVMPNMDGFQLLQERSQNAHLREVPVIAISARDPLGQPIVSQALALTRRGGLSVPVLLNCIKAIVQIVGMPGAAGDLAASAVS